jgi:BirA family biotin operon repressor/biotin-[acetyl-CoA-carboxylase] ligase
LNRPADQHQALSAARLKDGLHTRLVGRDIHVYDRVISTNDVLWELAARGAEEGTVVFADEQTAGRGRLGRTWWSPPGVGIWMSVLLKSGSPGGAVPTMTLAGALAVADAVRAETGLDAMIRWPNDVLVAGRKVAGVIVEARAGRSHTDLVLGMGVDVNAAPEDLPPELAGRATSLSAAAGRPVDRLRLARRLLTELDRWEQLELEGETGAIRRRWRELSATLGGRTCVEERGRRYSGTVIDLDAELGLVLRLDRGGIRHFRGEHVGLVTDNVHGG